MVCFGVSLIVDEDVDALCDLEDVDLSGQPATTTLFFDANAGQEAPKLMNGRTIDKYAQLVMTFSKNKGGQSMNQPDLVAYDSKTWSEVERYHTATNTSAPVIIPIFTYDYYDVSYDLTGKKWKYKDKVELEKSNSAFVFEKFVLWNTW